MLGVDGVQVELAVGRDQLVGDFVAEGGRVPLLNASREDQSVGRQALGSASSRYGGVSSPSSV
jgi:hypothetical protein